jgi:hypothetical protein
MSESEEPTAKVLFRVSDDDGDTYVETLWAVPLGDDRYRLGNSPFYAYGVSWEDIVYAPFDALEEFPTFQRVLEKSGNRTVRVVFEAPPEPGNEADQILKGVEALGCSWEGASPRYFSINIPPDVELSAICGYLTERDAEWEHADPRYSELHPDED